MHPYPPPTQLYTLSKASHQRPQWPTQRADKVREIKVEFFDCNLDVEWLQTKAWVAAIMRLSQTLSIGWFERECMEEYGNDQIQTPHFVGLSEAVDATHLSFLIRCREYATGTHLSRDGLEQIFAMFRTNIFAQLGQKLRSPFSFNLRKLIVQLNLALSLLVQCHAPIVLFVELSLSCLEIQPGERKRTDVG